MQKHALHNNYSEKKRFMEVTLNFGQVASISIVVVYFMASDCGGWYILAEAH